MTPLVPPTLRPAVYRQALRKAAETFPIRRPPRLAAQLVGVVLNRRRAMSGDLANRAAYLAYQKMKLLAQTRTILSPNVVYRKAPLFGGWGVRPNMHIHPND